MNYKTALKINDTLVLDKDYNISYNGVSLNDSMAKGYVYANLFFFDEVHKEIQKLHKLIEKIHKEVTIDLGFDPNDTMKLFFEISTRAHQAIGDDGLDSIIKEFLSGRSKHVALMPDEREKARFIQICEAIFMELVDAFYTMTLHTATDLEGGVKTFKFAREYIQKMTERQKTLVAPALRMVGLENQVKLNDLRISQDFTVKYMPELTEASFTKQEDTLKDQIKTFIQNNASKG